MGNKKLFLCSFGGKILARPRDRKLRYVGGETRIIQISDDASWEELDQALMRMYGQPHTIQYQVPGLGEDFHCLLSVSDDDELEDLMEYGVAYEGGSEKLIRIFLFPLDDDVDAHLSLTSEGDSRTHYLSAVNGVILESKASKGFHSEPSDPRARAELLHRLSKVEAASRLDGSDKYSAPKTQNSSPAALEDGLIEFEKDGEPANSVARSKSNAQNPSSKVEESLGEATSENLESGIEENEGLIIDSAVGKIDLGNMKKLDSDDIVELRELGSGGFGIVYHGSWKGRDVAIKRIKANSFGGQQSGQYRAILESLREAGILSTLHHQNIVSLYGFVLDEPKGTVAIVMELVVDGSLRNILFREDKYLDYRKRLIIAKGAAFGMEYLHLKKIVHFDLKCDNLLVDLKDPDQPICKVTDFGLSKPKKQNSLVSAGHRGTLPWMAPELLKEDDSMVSEKVDVFSFGIVMWEILTGKVPYADMNEGKILGGCYADTLRPPVPESCDPAWRRLMEQCWTSNPKERPSFTQIANRLHLMSLTSHVEGGE